MKTRGTKTQGAKHHSCRKGNPVTLKLHDGRVIAGKFVESNGGGVLLEDHPLFEWKDVRCFVVPGDSKRRKRPTA